MSAKHSYSDSYNAEYMNEVIIAKQLFPPPSFLTDESAVPPSVLREPSALMASRWPRDHFQMILYQQGERKIYQTLLFIKV